MNQPIRFYKPDSYEFPDDDLLELTALELRKVISNNVARATDHVDGLGGITPVMVDYAQDQIEQARDLLLDMGCTFTQDEVDNLPFLAWPLSEAEQAAEDRQRIADKIERERVYVLRQEQERIALTAVDDAIAGKLDNSSPVRKRIVVKLSQTGPSGAEVLSLVEQLHALGESSANLRSWHCTRPEYTFETDPCPAYAVVVELPTRPIIWLFLWAWYHHHRIATWPVIEYTFQDGAEPMSGWAYLTDQWPEYKDPMLSALENLSAETEDSSWNQ